LVTSPRFYLAIFIVLAVSFVFVRPVFSETQFNLVELAKLPPPPAKAGLLVQYELLVAGASVDRMPRMTRSESSSAGTDTPVAWGPVTIISKIRIHNMTKHAVLVHVGRSAVESPGHFVNAVTAVRGKNFDYENEQERFANRDIKLAPLEKRDLDFVTEVNDSDFAASGKSRWDSKRPKDCDGAGMAGLFIEFESDREKVIISHVAPSVVGL
jgi:hypothetical protein